jgi:hypothetical protein
MSASGLRRRPVTLVWLPHAALSVVGRRTFYVAPVADSKSVGSYLFATGIRRRRTGYATDEEIHVPASLSLSQMYGSKSVATFVNDFHFMLPILVRTKVNVDAAFAWEIALCTVSSIGRASDS